MNFRTISRARASVALEGLALHCHGALSGVRISGTVANFATLIARARERGLG
jgi:hypothetical protein